MPPRNADLRVHPHTCWRLAPAPPLGNLGSQRIVLGKWRQEGGSHHYCLARGPRAWDGRWSFSVSRVGEMKESCGGGCFSASVCPAFLLSPQFWGERIPPVLPCPWLCTLSCSAAFALPRGSKGLGESQLENIPAWVAGGARGPVRRPPSLPDPWPC